MMSVLNRIIHSQLLIADDDGDYFDGYITHAIVNQSASNVTVVSII